MSSETWLTVDEAAQRARVHAATLRREIKRGRLRHARVGGRKCIRIRPEWVDGWLVGATTPSEPSPYPAPSNDPAPKTHDTPRIVTDAWLDDTLRRLGWSVITPRGHQLMMEVATAVEQACNERERGLV